MYYELWDKNNKGKQISWVYVRQKIQWEKKTLLLYSSAHQTKANKIYGKDVLHEQ